jgi:hypothetical protein
MAYDTFNCADRAGFLERLARLAGQSTYREPGGGGSPYSARMMTTENALALALSFARRDKRDVGPEMVYTIATAVPHQSARVISWLGARLLHDTGPTGRKCERQLILLSTHCYEMVGYGKPVTRLPSRLPVAWDKLRDIGIGWLWMAAESTVERAEYTLHGEGKRLQMPSGKNGLPRPSVAA